jgi:UDPglucose--hexose-1-phosphate uridylyltransferase
VYGLHPNDAARFLHLMIMNFNPEMHPHRRLNLLTGEWILVSPHRTQRPWQGQQESVGNEIRPSHDPKCYLCPGNRRAGDLTNPDYKDTFVFSNDFPALLPDAPTDGAVAEGMFRAQPVQGQCRVICFSPRHDLTLPEMTVGQIQKVVDVWAAQVQELGARFKWVQVFENKGAAMGCSNPHPHGQIWAGNWLPRLVEQEENSQREHFKMQGHSLLLDYLAAELKAQARVIESNEHWVMTVPYWATWPFELLLVPRRAVKRLPELTVEERGALAEILKWSLTRFDNLFQTSFPYSMGWHGAPMDAENYSHWQLHAHFYPPLLRSATIKKFMVGYEMLAEPQRDLTAEQAAQRLCEVSTVHYKSAKA